MSMEKGFAKHSKNPWIEIAKVAGTDTRPAAIIGSGPSGNKFDFSLLDRDDLATYALNHQAWMNRDKYRADYCVWNDSAVLPPPRHNIKLPDGVRGICREGHVRLNGDTSNPWIAYPGSGWTYRTVATAGVRAALMLGAPRVALVCVDCYGDHHYWEAGDPETVVPHRRFLTGLTHLHKQLKGEAWRVVQTSMRSPLQAYRKVPFEEWLIEIGNEGLIRHT